ncbi:breast cancer type 1 susceptibility protein homolog isoform X2 [Stegostoma tigrinum]|uniref:breast cancer type 1 susceptibility protein homolog isoform X2 n=1 Tax=Stegostoma tigrinum TaxID=3053191 RepID=UPI0028703A0C|nr:breast cancer type 1 susceptibility protein homolog isoform X2 [Stegostoma tigrinum]
MSLCKSEIEHVHEVLSLMLKNLECPICLELMKEPISTKCDHQFCRFCILKLFGKKTTIPCPLCKNVITKRSLQESTRFKQLTEGIMKMIHAFQLDTGYEFSTDNTPNKTPTEISAYRDLWQDDTQAWSNNTPQNIKATGISKNRTLKVHSDPPLTEFVRRVSTRNKRQKVEGTPAYVGIDSDSSEEPLFKTHVNIKSTLHARTVNTNTTAQKEKVDQSDNDEKPCQGEESNLSQPTLEELFSSKIDDNDVPENTENTDVGDYSCATESETEQKQMTKDKSVSDFCSPEAPGKVIANENSLQIAAERVNKQNCTDGNKPFTDRTMLSSENALEKDANLLDNHEKLNQKVSNQMVKDETDFQRSIKQSKNSSVPQVSKRKSQRIMKKVSEWLSKINVDEMATVAVGPNPRDQNVESDSLAERENSASDKEASHAEDAEYVKNDHLSSFKQKMPKTTPADIKNKIFVKTYKRDKRKSVPVNWSFNSDSKSDDLTSHREDVFDSCSKSRKAKRKSNGLNPEDFIKRTVSEEDNRDSGVQNENNEIDPKENVPVFKNIETETNKEILDESSDVKQIDKLVVATTTKVAISNDIIMKDSEQTVQQLKSELCKPNAEGKKKVSKSLGRKGKKSSIDRTKKKSKPLQLVNHIVKADRSPRSNQIFMNENKIDSFPSSEEPVKAELETRITRRSSRLKLLEELIMQDKNKGKKSKLTRSHSVPSPSASFVPFTEPIEKNTEEGMVCLESENLPMLDVIVQTCKDPLPDLDCSKQDYVTSNESFANSVVEELEDSAVCQLKDCHKSAETKDAAVLAEHHPLRSDRSSFVAASGRNSEASGSEASSLLLAPQLVPGERPSDPQLDCRYVGKSEVTPCVGHSRAGTVMSKVNSREDVSVQQWTRSKDTNEDSEVDTELLLKSFRLSKRRSFILMAATEHQAAQDACTTAPDTQCFDNVAASNSEETKTEDAVIRDTDGNDGTRQELEKVNLDKIDSPNQDAQIASDDKSKLCTFTWGNVQQLLNRENGNSVEIVPPTASTLGSPLPPVLPQHVQKVVPPSRSRSKGNRYTRLLRKKGSNCSSSVVTIEKEIFDSDRSSQARANEKFSSNARENSWHTKNTKIVKNRGLEVAVGLEAQHDFLSTRLASSAHPESELFFSTRDLLRQEASEKDNCQENTSERSPKERGLYKTSNLPLNGLLVVENTAENKLDKSTDVAGCHTQPTFMNMQHSTTVKNETSENKCSEISQISSITPDGLLDNSGGTLNKIISKTVDELDEVQSVYELRSCEEQLRQHEAVVEKPVSSSHSKSSSEGQLKGRRKRPVKLSTSESETSDEELPCFQIFGFSRSRSNAPTVSESPSVTGYLSSKGSPGQVFLLPNSSTEAKKADCSEPNKLEENVGSEGSLKNKCLSPSQESGESPDLFSSQSDGSSPDASPQPKMSGKTLRQINALSVTELENHEKNYSTVEETVGAQHLQPPCLEGENVPGNDSEASHIGDSSPESEILTTQQRYAIQDNIKKLEHEMAVLEAVLDEHGSQDSEHLLSMNDQEDCPDLIEFNGSEVTTGFYQGHTENLKSRSRCLPAAEVLNTSVTFMHEVQEESECPESLGDLEIRQIPEKHQAANDLLDQFQAKAGSKDEMTNSPNAAQKEGETKVHVKSDCEESQSTENVGNASTLQPENENANRRTILQSCEENRSSPTSSPVFNKTSSTTKNTVVTIQRNMSLVASGLNKNENLLVETFARKTGATFLSTFSTSTTHVIMKTDADLVCERTLKYFMGIAGRRWVVSYQWITECFRKGMVIDEREFEVKGDVINGRSHNGPRKARETPDEKLLLSHYEVCCFGSFTDQLEWMVELCGASIIKEPYLFTYSPNRTVVVIVQPDANPENTDYRAIQRQYNNIVVTREWILDSVACYRNHQLDAYLVCLPH